MFHAVLLINDQIYDLGYLNTPTVISFEHYFKTMWDQGSLLTDFRFQIKHAKNYKLFDRDGFMNDSPYLTFTQLKELTARELLF